SKLVERRDLRAFSLELRREVDQIVERDALSIVSGRFGRKWLGGGVPLARDLTLRNRSLLNRPYRGAVRAIEDVEPSLLRRLDDGFDPAAVPRDVRENGCARDVHVPDSVVYELVIPLVLAGLQVDRDKRFAEQALPWAVTAVIVARW